MYHVFFCCKFPNIKGGQVNVVVMVHWYTLAKFKSSPGPQIDDWLKMILDPFKGPLSSGVNSLVLPSPWSILFVNPSFHTNQEGNKSFAIGLCESGDLFTLSLFFFC